MKLFAEYLVSFVSVSLWLLFMLWNSKKLYKKQAGYDIMKYLFQVLELNKKVGYNVNMSLLINQFLIDLNGGI